VTVVDTSVWIDYFNGTDTKHTVLLDRLLGREHIVVGDLILAELLQGFRTEADAKAAQSALAAFETVSMVGPELACRAAANYRRLRRRGVTVRKTMDALIATWCMAAGQRLLYADRDFDPFAVHLGLVPVAAETGQSPG
jgi:predicted nucleic acid-binding protein